MPNGPARKWGPFRHSPIFHRTAASTNQARGRPRAVGRRVGDSYDNALAETINGLYKAEVIHRRGPRRTLQAVEYATLEWVDWFNNRRLLEPIGNVPPAEAEAAYYRELEEPTPIAA
jgi:transposase InsO family protein